MFLDSTLNQEMGDTAAEQPFQGLFFTRYVGGTQQHLTITSTDAAAQPWLGRLSSSRVKRNVAWLGYIVKYIPSRLLLVDLVPLLQSRRLACGQKGR